MYQVVKMFGDWEPWWFIEGWEEDITEIAEYDTLSEALLYFQEEWDRGPRRTHENFLFILLCPDINFEKIPF